MRSISVLAAASIALIALAPAPAQSQFADLGYTSPYYAPAFYGPGPVYLATYKTPPADPHHVHTVYAWHYPCWWGPTNHLPWYVNWTAAAPSEVPGKTVSEVPGKTITIGAFDKIGFKPKSANVEPGTTVRWVNQGEQRHTVTSRTGLFDSGPIAPGGSFSHTFDTPGTYHYFCGPHEKLGMVGTIVVGPSKSPPKPGDRGN